MQYLTFISNSVQLGEFTVKLSSIILLNDFNSLKSVHNFTSNNFNINLKLYLYHVNLGSFNHNNEEQQLLRLSTMKLKLVSLEIRFNSKNLNSWQADIIKDVLTDRQMKTVCNMIFMAVHTKKVLNPIKQNKNTKTKFRVRWILS